MNAPNFHLQISLKSAQKCGKTSLLLLENIFFNCPIQVPDIWRQFYEYWKKD